MKASISCAVIRMVKTGWRIIWMIHYSTNQCFLQNASSLYELSLHIWGATGEAWIQKTQTRQISQLAQSPVLTPLVLFCYTVFLKQYKISDIGFKSVSHFRVLDKSSAEQSFSFTFCRGCFTFIAMCGILNNAIIHLIPYSLTPTEIPFPEIYVC